MQPTENCTEPYTACRDCRHARVDGPGSWEQVCTASPRREFVAWSGEWKQTGFRLCSDVNTDGRCEKFEAKNA